MTHDEYRQAFAIPSVRKGDAEQALKLALDIRKFEIELYWKRATYFWAFLAVTLGAYFTLLVAQGIPSVEKGEPLLIVSCLGVVFSVAWYFVNRASKFWQENWEKHVDLLEDAVIGPMYKTVLSDAELSFWKLCGPYPFSVSKLNQILSLFVLLLFFLLWVATVSRYYHWIPNRFIAWLHTWLPNYFATAMVGLTVVVIVALCWKGRTGPGGSRVQAQRRTTELLG